MTANSNTRLVKKQIEEYDISNPDATLHLATDLARFIRENKLFQNIQGKEYVNVEGWQYAGSRLGILPVIGEVNNISVDGEIKYSAVVKLLNLRNDQTVGAGFAICSNKEPGKKFYQEFAIASMAQTRAIGKAYRNILAWIIRAAGYEPTPAEEMELHHETMENKMDTYIGSFDTRATGSKLKAAEAEPEEAPAAKSASVKQREQLIKLLNHPLITGDEKNKMLLKINEFDGERAKQAIAKLKKTIEERSDGASAAA